MGMCGKCTGISASLFLVFGVLFLLRDFGVWDVFNISAWSALFIIVGLAMYSKGHCNDCKAMSGKSK